MNRKVTNTPDDGLTYVREPKLTRSVGLVLRLLSETAIMTRESFSVVLVRSTHDKSVRSLRS